MPYRDDQASLEARRDELRKDLAEMDRKSEELSEAVRAREAVARELSSVEGRLRRAASRRLPLLDGVRIASPCSASWDEMKGDEQVRFCGKCEKNVYNLSAMSSDEAEQLIAGREGSVCVRLYRRQDGTVLTTDCPVGVRRKRVRRVLAVAAGAGALAAAASATFTQQGDIGPPIARMGAVTSEQVTTAPLPPLATAQPAEMGSAQAAPPEPPKSPAKQGKTPATRQHTMGQLAL
jgi:hypothetical protein